ncbi:MAG: insulinase family protein [Myxococcales bacterium]|nr:insulinase family protein [Myxococcales bacterium]
MRALLLVPIATLTLACGSTPPPPASAPAPAPAADPLGPKPTLPAPTAFTPPVAEVLKPKGAPPVWLLARDDLPLVTVQVVIPYGSAADPAGKGGVAALTAEMMEQGAGRRGALELSHAVDRLGASLTVTADRDLSAARLVVLKQNLKPALALLADVVGRPRFEDAEWGRTHPVWLAGLRTRAFEPSAVASVAADAALFGAGHPYAHPVDGTVESVEGVTLADVKAFHARHWRPDRATVVVGGAVTAAELEALLPEAFLGWAGAGEPPPAPTAPPAPTTPTTPVLVERPDSPQTMLLVVAPGPAAGAAGRPAEALVYTVLGGTFTSRLNQVLREDKGYTYGARARLPFQRGPGRATAGASVQTKVTQPALSDLRAQIAKMQAEGPTAAELEKARATARNGDVQAYEAVDDAADRLALLAGLGLAPEYDAAAAKLTEAVDLEAAKKAAAGLTLPAGAVVAVGDPAVVRAALQGLGLPAPQVRDASGAVAE